MFEVRSKKPHGALLSVVREFSQRRARFGEMIVVRPLHARPHQFLEFYHKEPYQVEDEGLGFSQTPGSVLVGPCLSPGKRLGFQGEIETFTIHFQPTGLSRLFGLSMTEMADQAFDASDVIGRAVRGLGDQLSHQTRFEARIEVAQAWVYQRLNQARAATSVDWAARLLARTGGRVSVDRLAAWSDLSARQLQRRFLTEVGASPKHYARLHRFSSLIDARRKTPHRAWADLAIDHGFADQAHLIRETQRLAGRTPELLIQQLLAVPEQNA